MYTTPTTMVIHLREAEIDREREMEREREKKKKKEEEEEEEDEVTKQHYKALRRKNSSSASWHLGVGEQA